MVFNKNGKYLGPFCGSSGQMIWYVYQSTAAGIVVLFTIGGTVVCPD